MLAILFFALDLLGSFADGGSLKSSSDLDFGAGLGVCARVGTCDFARDFRVTGRGVLDLTRGFAGSWICAGASATLLPLQPPWPLRRRQAQVVVLPTSCLTWRRPASDVAAVSGPCASGRPPLGGGGFENTG